MPKNRKKVRFIDPDKSIKFKLENRSQRDPLCVDPDAPQHVLTAMGKNVGFSDLASETTVGRLKRWSKQRTYGVGFEDDYDYMKHLRVPDEERTAELIPMEIPTNSKRKALAPVEEEEGEEEEEQLELMRDEEAVLKLPAVLFPSEIEAEESLLQRGNCAIGPRPDWDPDIVAALDDDFDFEDPELQLEDDIVAQLIAPGEGEEDSDVDSRLGDFDSDDLMSDDEDGSVVGEMMETRSRFTGHSLSSSVMRRSEGLQTLDARFEHVLKLYENGNGYGDNADEGGLFEEDEGGIDCEDAMRILNIKKMEKVTLFPEVKHVSVAGNVPNKAGILAKFEYERDHDEDLVTIYKKVPAVKHDAVSILSTYSNIYNRPKLIELPSKKPKKKKPVKEVKEVPKPKAPKAKVPTGPRNKEETKEEKRERKQAVKEGKKARRQEKKATKDAFQTEKTRRQQELVNIQKNLQGIKL